MRLLPLTGFGEMYAMLPCHCRENLWFSGHNGQHYLSDKAHHQNWNYWCFVEII